MADTEFQDSEKAPALEYKEKKRKLVLYKDGKAIWSYKFKGIKRSNIERIFAYILQNPKKEITLAELSEKAKLTPSKRRIVKAHQAFPNNRKLTNADYFYNYRLDDEIKKVFRRGKLDFSIVTQLFDLHYNKVCFLR